MVITSQSKKIFLEAAIWGTVAYILIRAHSYVLPVDTQYRILLPILVCIPLFTKRDIPFVEKMRSHAIWATFLSLILSVMMMVAWSTPPVRSLVLAITMIGFFAPAMYALSLIVRKSDSKAPKG